MGLQQVHPQRRPAHLRLYLGHAEVPRPGQVESSLHCPERLFDLEADAPDLGVECLAQRVHGLARAALVVDQITNAALLEPLPVGLAGVALVGQHGLHPG